MKSLFTALVLVSQFGFAADGEHGLKVTAFYPLNGSRGASELCGRMTGEVLAEHRILIVSDPKHNPGPYTILPGADGKFCALINSVTGRADVFLMRGGVKQQSVEAAFTQQSSRTIRP
jgi:hypothetical protein